MDLILALCALFLALITVWLCQLVIPWFKCIALDAALATPPESPSLLISSYYVGPLLVLSYPVLEWLASSSGAISLGFPKRVDRAKKKRSKRAVIGPDEAVSIRYMGTAALPEKSYVEDSHAINISLKRVRLLLSSRVKPLLVLDARAHESLIDLVIDESSIAEDFLEIELLAAGLEVAGARRQRQRLSSEVLSYHWNCHFKSSGNHMITLIVRLVRPDQIIELETVNHAVKVRQLDGLTKRGILLLGGIGSVITTILAWTTPWMDIWDRLGVW